MQDRIKNIVVTIGFVIILIGIFFTNVIVKDKPISTTERRKLAQFPEISFVKIISGDVMGKWEDYVADQFVARDLFRTIKSVWSINIFKQKDNNDLFIKDKAIYKMEYPLNEKNLEKSIDKINNVYQKYLQNMNVYYAIIPDKNYYLENDEHLKIDYEKVKETAKNKLNEFSYIDIWDDLKLDDYYKTDLHWKQENLQKVVKQIQESMNLESTEEANYFKKDMGDFFGTYYGQLGLNLSPDRLYVLTNDILENCTTYNYENKKTSKVYENVTSSDKYDIYLSGATSIISIENPNAKTQKELLLFRDSFGSSLAPLLVENYSKITLIDLRYISSKLLENYIEFEDQDVLFLYSTVVLNQNVFK
jgi:hypothetical protein